MPFVLDASIAVCWAFGDEEHLIATRARERLADDEARAPSLWWFEVRNALIAGERRGRILESEVGGFLQDLARLPIRLDSEPIETDLLSLARRHRLAVYDAAYLELAQREGALLATLDRALTLAATAIRVELV